MRRLWRGRRWVSVAGAVSAVVLVGCGPFISPLDPSLGAAFITVDGMDTYGLTLSDGVVTVSAPDTNQSMNTRVAFWRLADPASTDQQTCATWVNLENPLQQHGAALRIRTVDGRTRAITITKNIWFAAGWIFNVHVMDSGGSPDQNMLIGQFELSEVFRPLGPTSFDVPPFPWRMCARVVGDTVSFLVWPLTHAEPAWDDPRYGGSVTLPPGWNQPGVPGWYIGHLSPGESTGFTDMSTAVVGSATYAPIEAGSELATSDPALASAPSEPPTATDPALVPVEETAPAMEPTAIPLAP